MACICCFYVYAPTCDYFAQSLITWLSTHPLLCSPVEAVAIYHWLCGLGFGSVTLKAGLSVHLFSPLMACALPMEISQGDVERLLLGDATGCSGDKGWPNGLMRVLTEDRKGERREGVVLEAREKIVAPKCSRLLRWGVWGNSWSWMSNGVSNILIIMTTEVYLWRAARRGAGVEDEAVSEAACSEGKVSWY